MAVTFLAKTSLDSLSKFLYKISAYGHCNPGAKLSNMSINRHFQKFFKKVYAYSHYNPSKTIVKHVIK